MVRLSKYKAKRKFANTPEPSAKSLATKSGKRLKFCVQRHSARRLHYDLRLELDGVLVSFAVPKGPSMNPHERRLAIHVEDHPLDYLTFEGEIPAGNYGAGSVQLWDIGYYTADPKSMRAGLKSGHLHFTLHGKKLTGDFVLVRLKDKDQWLLRKVADTATKAITKKSPMPTFVKPMLAAVADEPFDDADWLFEIKWDGYRALAFIRGARTELFSRNHLSLKKDYPSLLAELKEIDHKAIIDGEVVALDDKGLPHFELLQNCARNPDCVPQYMAFDLLFLDGLDLRSQPLLERKKLLQDLLNGIDSDAIHYNDHVIEQGVALFDEVKKLGLEGLIAKKAESVYESARSRNWLKIKSAHRDDFVIAGFTKSRAASRPFASLLLGEMKEGELKFIGHVGTGFNAKSMVEIMTKLKPLIIKKAPFHVPPKTNTAATFVQPKLLAEISFAERTAAGILRQPVFHGIRNDKDFAEVKSENVADAIVTNPEKIFGPKMVSQKPT